MALSVVKTFAGIEDDWLNDNKYLTEMDLRYDELITEIDKEITIDQLEGKIKKPIRSAKEKLYESYS